MYFRGNFDALCCVGRGRKETIFAVERARQSIISAMRNETNDIVPSFAFLSFFLWTHFSTHDLTRDSRKMINEGIRGMLLKTLQSE